jgi:hypothetical protein
MHLLLSSDLNECLKKDSYKIKKKLKTNKKIV